MDWWYRGGHVDARKILYRSRFEPVWNSLPQLTILAAMPGWGKRTWMEQCADHLTRERPAIRSFDAADLDSMVARADSGNESKPQRLALLDGRSAATEPTFWVTLAQILEARPWLSCVVATYDEPPHDLTALIGDVPATSEENLWGLIENAVVLNERDLAFNPEERANVTRLLVDEGLLRDLIPIGANELGCPYLIGQQITRLSRNENAGSWTPTDPSVVNHLLALLNTVETAEGFGRSHIGGAFEAARSFRSVTDDLLTAAGIEPRNASNAIRRFSDVPLFDHAIDDEVDRDAVSWRSSAWRAVAAAETDAMTTARLERGHEAVQGSGRTAAPLFYLLQLGRLREAEILVRRNFRWFLIFADAPLVESVISTAPDPRATPALVLLRAEFLQRERGLQPQLRGAVSDAVHSLRSWRASSLGEEIERSGLLAFGATLMGSHEHVRRYLDHVRELLATPSRLDEITDETDQRIRMVGACYLAYWAALQTDQHVAALELATQMLSLSRPDDRMYFYELVSLSTQQDFLGVRSLSPSGAQPPSEPHSQSIPLIYLEDARDAEAASFLTPLLARELSRSRSAVDGLILLVQGLIGYEGLSVPFVEAVTRRSSESWRNRQPSSFIVCSAVIALASMGARNEARSWVATLGEQTDVFSSLAHGFLSLWEGEPLRAIEHLHDIRDPQMPRFEVCAQVLTAAAHAVRADESRALMALTSLWRAYPSPRLIRFALRMIPQGVFEWLHGLRSEMPSPLAELFDDAQSDNRTIRWDSRPKLTMAEQEILRLLADGMSNQQIASARFVNVSTLRTQLKTLYRKLGVSGRTEALDALTRWDLTR